MNVFTFSGRCAADAELRRTQSGEPVLSFRVANDTGYGERKTVNWIDCSYWGKRAEAVSNFIKKGDKIAVSGELRLEEYTARDGSTKSKLAVRVNDLDLAAKSEGASSGDTDRRASGNNGGGGGGRDHGGQPSRGGAGGRGGGKPSFDEDLDDSIPF